MEMGAIFLLLCLIGIVGLFVAQPFTKGRRVRFQSSHEISTLLAERERALTALQELDFDNEIGKIPAEEYIAQRAALIQKGSGILRELDEMQSGQAIPVTTLVEPAKAKEPIRPPSDEELEDLIAKRRALRQQKTAGFCPNCGKPVAMSDQFCPSCGQKVNLK
jgi:rubrerythrin